MKMTNVPRAEGAAKRWGLSVLLLLGLVAAGCQQQPEQPEQKAAPLASTVHTGDPQLSGQLLSGFYGIEQGAWRWTAQSFSVRLHPPAGTAQTGANLAFAFTIPDSMIQKLKTVTLSAEIAGTALAPETYSKGGAYTYKREVAANLLTGDAVRVDFKLDKSQPPSGGDQRQLGIVAGSFGLVPK